MLGHSASFPLPVLHIYVAQREEIPSKHTYGHAHPPNSPLSSCDLESFTSSTGQRDLGHKGGALSILDCKELDIAKATAGKENFHHEFSVLCLLRQKGSLSFPWD